LIPQQVTAIKRKVNAFKAAKKEYYVVCSVKRFKKGMFEFFNVPLMALKKGVKIRCIVKNIEDNFSFEELNKLKQHPNYQLRQISYNPLIQFSVIDNEQAFIVTEAHPELLETPSLWTNNPCIISLLSDYFEILWKKAR
jgi:sugar-specific transcriptional regulator TrmB